MPIVRILRGDVGVFLLCIGILFGIVVGILFGVVGIGIAYEAVPFKEWLYRWQALLAGFMAAFASFIIFYSAIYTEVKKNKSKEMVARTFFTNSLSLFTNYLNSSMSLICELYSLSGSRNNGVVSLNSSLPVLDDKVLYDFKVLMELSDPNLSRVISAMVCDFQVVNSRLVEIYTVNTRKTLIKPTYNYTYYYECMYFLAFLKTMVDRFYPYCRNFEEFNFSKVDSREIRLSFRLLDVFLETTQYSRLSRQVEVLREKINDPMRGCINSIKVK